MALIGASSSAAPGPPEIPFVLVDGKPCARATVASEQVSIPGNVVIQFGLPAPLVLHEKTASLLKVQAGDRVVLTFGDVRLPGLPVRAAGVKALEDLTREHASELGEIPVVGLVGLPAFEGFRPQLDIEARVLRLLPAFDGDTADAESDDSRVGEPARPDGSRGEPALPAAVIPYEADANGYWLRGVGPDDFPFRVLLSTAQHDTVIDETVALVLDAPAGNLETLRIGPFDIARLVALRPEDLSGTAAAPQVVLGTGLLSAFRVTADLTGRQLHIEQVRVPRFPREEQEFFVARAAADTEGIEQWLIAHGASRLAREAAELVLAQRLAERPGDRAALVRAMRLRADATPPARRAGELVQLADHLLQSDRGDRFALASAALDVGQESAAADLNARAVHDIHARQGLIALRQDNLHEARRHLLSAAFGIPRDPQVNLRLGELYERMGKLSRAWSRYVQALLADENLVDAKRGLDRLNRNPKFRGEFTMEDARQLLEGRVVEFHPPQADRRKSASDGPPPPRLIELFTCVDHPDTAAAELAFGGLAECLAGAGTVFIEYHRPVPQPDALANEAAAARAAYYGVERTPVARFDGSRSIEAAGDSRRVAEVFTEYKLACELSPDVEPEWHITGHVALAGDELVARFALDGPAGGGDLRLWAILCEGTVMLPGSNALFLHRQVARYALSPAGGFQIAGAAGQRTFEARALRAQVTATLEQSVAAMEEEQNITFYMRPTYVDPGRCNVAVFLQDQQSHQVLAARLLEIVPLGEPKP